jgi:HlyD family secretion protein
MEIKTKAQTKGALSKRVMITFLCATSLIVLWSIASKEGSYNEGDVSIYSVKKGSVSITESAYGKIKAKTSNWINTQSGGYVKSIYKRTGDYISVGEPILALTNLELEIKIDNSTQRLNEQQAELSSLMAQIEGERLTEARRINTLRYEFNTAKIELDALEQLLDRGVTSKVEYEKRKLYLNELSFRLDNELDIVAGSTLYKGARIEAQQLRINGYNKQISSLNTQKENLVVKATHNGVISKLSKDLQLGSKIDAGMSLLEITDTSSLYAEIKVPVQKVKMVRVGNSVNIDIQGLNVKASVIRIVPVTNDGYVFVDVEFDSGVDIEGDVIIGSPLSAKIHTGESEIAFYVDFSGNNVIDIGLGYYSIKGKKTFNKIRQEHVLYVRNNKVILNGIEEGAQIAFIKESNQRPEEFTILE